MHKNTLNFSVVKVQKTAIYSFLMRERGISRPSDQLISTIASEDIHVNTRFHWRPATHQFHRAHTCRAQPKTARRKPTPVLKRGAGSLYYSAKSIPHEKKLGGWFAVAAHSARQSH
jgi:hypothetical protein